MNVLDDHKDRIFVASVSPQVRASIAATYGLSERQAGFMIDQLLAGPQGLSSGGSSQKGFDWVVDTNIMREVSLVLGAQEVLDSLSEMKSHKPNQGGIAATDKPKRPILSSACPGWICYAEKTHPHVLPHLSRLKSPQALTGTLLKTSLSRRLQVAPSKIWHLAVMPCFDKKLEASREELTDVYWQSASSTENQPPVRDVDCVITARELLMLADSRGISFPSLPRRPPTTRRPLPDPALDRIFFPRRQINHNAASNGQARASSYSKSHSNSSREAGTSGGYLHHILQTQLQTHPGSTLTTSRGRNADVIEYTIHSPSSSDNPQSDSPVLAPSFKAARYYGFRNIQNLVRKLKPPRTSRMLTSMSHTSRPGRSVPQQSGTGAGPGPGSDYAYVEVMACPGGCTNGGGQIKVDDLPSQSVAASTVAGTSNGVAGGKISQKEWLAKVDEAYFSMSSSSSSDEDGEAEDEDEDPMNIDPAPNPSTFNNHIPSSESMSTSPIIPSSPETINNISIPHIRSLLEHWTSSTGIPLTKLVNTSYRKVESDVGKTSNSSSAGGDGARDTERVAELAGRIGGGW